MKNKEFLHNKIAITTVNLVVLGLTFYFICMTLSFHTDSDILLLAILYASVVHISVKLGKHMFSTVVPSLSTILKLMLNNAIGLLIGASFMLILALIIPGFSKFSAAIVIASIMAFFVLGTLSSLIRSEKYTRT